VVGDRFVRCVVYGSGREEKGERKKEEKEKKENSAKIYDLPGR